MRGQSASLRIERPIEVLFAISSVITPFALGAVVGAIASGRVPPGNARGDLITTWLNPTSIAVGVLAVASTAYIAAVWLSADAARLARADLVDAFRTLGDRRGDRRRGDRRRGARRRARGRRPALARALEPPRRLPQ